MSTSGNDGKTSGAQENLRKRREKRGKVLEIGRQKYSNLHGSKSKRWLSFHPFSGSLFTCQEKAGKGHTRKNLPVTKSPKISQHKFYHGFFASAILAEEPA